MKYQLAVGRLGTNCAAERRTALWRDGRDGRDGRDDEFLLVAGKVHNVRLARRSFDGIVVQAGG